MDIYEIAEAIAGMFDADPATLTRTTLDAGAWTGEAEAAFGRLSELPEPLRGELLDIGEEQLDDYEPADFAPAEQTPEAMAAAIMAARHTWLADQVTFADGTVVYAFSNSIIETLGLFEVQGSGLSDFWLPV